MARLRWFKFFYIYKDAFNEIPFWEVKKLLYAMLDYAEYGKEPIKLSKKSMAQFNSFKSFYEADRELYKVYGSRGGKKTQKNIKSKG